MNIDRATNLAKFKVKIKSLTEESLIIKKEERSARYEETRNSLYLHRIGIVRREQRYTLLAYGFYKGKKYRQLEKDSKNKPTVKTINRILKSLTGESSEELVNWLENVE